MKIKCLIPFLAVSLLAFTACHNETLPEGVMTDTQMVDFLSEAYLLEGFYAIETHGGQDSVSAEVAAQYGALLKKHGITADQFDKSVAYYTAHMDKYSAIHQEVISRLEEDAQ